MAAWTVILPVDLNRFLVGAQVSALRSAALASGQADPASDTIRDKANYVRARIGGKVRLSATALSVPPELIEHVCMLALETLSGRLPGLALSQDQTNRISRIYKDLDIAGTPDFPVSAATDPEVFAADNSTGSIRILQPGCKANSRDKMSGI